MKNNKFLPILALILLVVACKKETVIPIDPITPPPPPVYVPIFEPGDTSKGAAYAKKLTAYWMAETYCKKSYSDANKLSIHFYTYNSDGSRRESLSFGPFSKDSIGVYQLTTFTVGIPLLAGEVSSAYGTWTSDGDVTEDFYRIDSTDRKNCLAITKIDLENKRVEGTFHASYNLQEPRINPLNPKKVTFSEGRFWATIRD